MSKRQGEAMEAVDVQGFGKRWRVAGGMTAEEAIVTIANEISAGQIDIGIGVWSLPGLAAVRRHFNYFLSLLIRGGRRVHDALCECINCPLPSLNIVPFRPHEHVI